MKMGNFPLMLRFLGGAASNNSGGSYTGQEELKFGTVEEYATAEKWLGEFCSVLSPRDTGGCAYGLGMFADDGVSVYEIAPEGKADSEGNALAMPYEILNRFY